MAFQVIMPKQVQSVETCIITQWPKSKGEPVKKVGLLFSYETDKAAFDVGVEEDGILLEIFRQEGKEVPVHSTLAVIGKPGEGTNAFVPDPIPAIENKLPEEQPIPSGSEDRPKNIRSSTAGDRLHVSPRARNMTAKQWIELSAIQGSGPNRRIIALDIELAVKNASIAEESVTHTPVTIEQKSVSARSLNASPVVVGSPNWITPACEMEKYFFPQPERILDAIHERVVPLNGHQPTTDWTLTNQINRSKLGTRLLN